MSAQQEATAWMLNLGQSMYAAIGDNELVHIIDYSEIEDLQSLLSNRETAMHWQGKELNVINLANYLSDSALAVLSSEPIIGVVAYQSDDDRFQYGGLLMAAIPAKKSVNNSQACDLPEPLQKWRDIAVSCFSDEGKRVPVLDLTAVFSTGIS